LTGSEVTLTVMEKDGGFRIDNRVRRDAKFPVGVMDVLSVVRTN
jgi:ribosomal protein S4E